MRLEFREFKLLQFEIEIDYEGFIVNFGRRIMFDYVGIVKFLCMHTTHLSLYSFNDAGRLFEFGLLNFDFWPFEFMFNLMHSPYPNIFQPQRHP